MTNIDQIATTEESWTILTFDWVDWDAPGNGGFVWIKMWRGSYFVTSTYFDTLGPFASVDEALQNDCFYFKETPNPKLKSEVLPKSKLIEIGRNMASEGGTITINGQKFELFGGNLYPGVTHRDASSTEEM